MLNKLGTITLDLAGRIVLKILEQPGMQDRLVDLAVRELTVIIMEEL